MLEFDLAKEAFFFPIRSLLQRIYFQFDRHIASLCRSAKLLVSKRAKMSHTSASNSGLELYMALNNLSLRSKPNI